MVRTIVPFIERRRHPRHPTAGWACLMREATDPAGLLTNVALLDLSSGGLSGASGRELPLAQRVTVMLPSDLDLNLPARQRVGRIVRCRRRGPGTKDDAGVANKTDDKSRTGHRHTIFLQSICCPTESSD